MNKMLAQMHYRVKQWKQGGKKQTEDPTEQNKTMETNNQNLPGANEEHVNLSPSSDNEQGVNNENKKQPKEFQNQTISKQ